ncbi:hypothetical protein HHK36_023729 [Tetracentron sinense]|uniref:SPRY domain-containing protein n=1 Tax=Tetracentron sinense TaxID=13715 RepID=A0A834YLR9_TETSI|nr:hypothetical protein HHK36_023729 [Tetracentron sinense]
MASRRKREIPKAEESEVKRGKITATDSLKSEAKQLVELNPADCNLDFNIEGNGLQGHALHEQGFAYCWSGARANVGITGGKYCFSCKIISGQPVDMEDTSLDQKHVCRVGISRGDDPVGNLGETEHSFGFGGTGKFSNAGKFADYGTKFGIGDTIVCAVNLENRPSAYIGFSKNGKWLGPAKQFDAGPKGLGVVDSPMRKLQWESALFPHVLLKNVVVEVQFSIEDGLVPEEGYKPWASALEDGNAIMGPTFSHTKDCEVMMMVGLPASGKTTWAEKWVKEHSEMRYVLLGTNLALEQMKVPGLLRKNNYGERFDRLMDRATGIFNTLLARASKTPRSYILDQTNVYKSARKRKLKPFVNYRKIAVVVFPKPDELKLRAEKRSKEMGKEVPAEAVNEMLANYVLPMSKDMPGSDEYFDQVMFPELNRVESQRYLDEMKRALGSTSNLNSKNNLSPYSRECSVRSFTSPSLQNRGASSVTGVNWQNSHSPLPRVDHDYQSPQQMNSTYLGVGLHGKPDFVSEHGRHTNYGRNSLPRADSNPHGSYGGYDHYNRQDYGSISTIPGDGSGPYGSYGGADPRPNFEIRSSTLGDPYKSYGVADPYSRPNFERASSYGSHVESYGSPVESARTSSFAYNSPGGHLRDAGAPHAAMQAPREPPFLHGPSPTSYGSPYGTPPPRPSYGNSGTELRYSGGYTPPGPRYY